MKYQIDVKSEFSIGDSILSVEDIFKEAKPFDIAGIALLDTMSVTGLIEFSKTAQKNNVKALIGCKLRFVKDVTWRKTKEDKNSNPEFYLDYYVLSEKGLKALYRLLTLANTEDRFYGNPRLLVDDLISEIRGLTNKDFIIASGAQHSLITMPDAALMLKSLLASHDAFTRLVEPSFYMTLSATNTPYHWSHNALALKFAKDLSLPCLVARPVAYADSDATSKDVMNSIVRNVKITQPWIHIPYIRNYSFLSEDDWKNEFDLTKNGTKRRFSDLKFLEDAFTCSVKNTEMIFERCNYVWTKQPITLPKITSANEFDVLKSQCKIGWNKRFSKEVFGHKPNNKELKELYLPRLQYELSVIEKLGFSNYFLLVQDVVSFAKSNGILVGPGRGSVGGSLIAYLIGITECDPIRFDLLFERFINPDRIDLPDADLDFMSTRRAELVDYLKIKYGEENVACISNYATMAASSSMRNVCRFFDFPISEYEASKFVPKIHGQPVSLEEAAKQVREIEAFRFKYPQIFSICLDLEDKLRNMGQHAAGVVVSGEPLVNRAVIETRKGEKAICWDKRIVEDQGLVKIDILGLSTLDLIDMTLNYIAKRNSGFKPNIMEISLNDQKVLKNFGLGKTIGVFQFESGGMRKLLRELGRDDNIRFDDIVAATALYRPGPMESGMMDSYYLRKQGREPIEYTHPKMEPILKPTFGVAIYQEQIMQISRDIAGYSAADADKLRKIMGKKLPEEMKKEREKFVNGCIATISCNKDWANELFDSISGWAGYGFNKSHSVEYALISYQCMWLKTYYPVEFLSAALSLLADEKLSEIVREAASFGISIESPDLNLSSERFEIISDKEIIIPFTKIKGFSENTAQAIIEARGTKPFTSKEDFVARVNKRKCNSAKIEILNKIGAFASVDHVNPSKNDESRLYAKIEFIPELISDLIIIDREMNCDKITKARIAQNVQEYRELLGPNADDEMKGYPVKPSFGKNAAFVAIFDAPSNEEEKNGSFSLSRSFNYVYSALMENDLDRSYGYWTGLIKSPKASSKVSNEEIKAYSKYLDKELELLKPTTIVILGSSTLRYFFPDFKGKAFDMAGKVVYDSKRNCNFVLGFNPNEIYHDETKQSTLNEIFGKVKTLIGV